VPLPQDLNGVSYDELLNTLRQDLQLVASTDIQASSVQLLNLGPDVLAQLNSYATTAALASYETTAAHAASLGSYETTAAHNASLGIVLVGHGGTGAHVSWGMVTTGSGGAVNSGSGDWSASASGNDTAISFATAKSGSYPTAVVSCSGAGLAPPYIGICAVTGSSGITVGAIDSSGTHHSGAGIGFIFLG